jgi:NDP-sugar pyrophosphorylase family protein
MILAAGRGTRLRPLTETTPKILVPVAGVPMLERLLTWLASGGVTKLALNTHHLAAAVAAHVERLRPRFPGLAVHLFHEPELLGTGGALINIRAFWDGEPLLVWNGDALADCEPAALAAARRASGAWATLAVHNRPGERSRLLVDESGRVVGIDSPARGGRRLLADPRGELRAVAFTGISLLMPELLERIARPGAFDLIEALLEMIGQGGVVGTLDLGERFWGTSGSPELLARLETDLAARPPLLARFTPTSP